MEQKYIKLSKYANNNCITYQTAFKHWNKGILDGKQLSTGTILIKVEEEEVVNEELKVVTYARVSSSQNKKNLEKQSERLVSYANAKGYKIHKVVTEIGSGLNDERKKLQSILEDESIKIIIVEHKDRFSRFGMKYIELLLKKQGREIIIINETSNDEQDLMQDFVSIITSFTARLYGKRRSKRKTETIIKELNSVD